MTEGERKNSGVDILAKVVSNAGVTAEQAASNLSSATEVLRKGPTKVHTAKRTKLPDVRAGLTRKAQACGMEFYITVNFFPGTNIPAECFCRIAKEGSTIAGFVEALMITISIAFQYGVPWAVLYDKFLHQIFEPRDDKSSSLVDAIGKVITLVIKDWVDAEKGNFKLRPVKQPEP